MGNKVDEPYDLSLEFLPGLQHEEEGPKQGCLTDWRRQQLEAEGEESQKFWGRGPERKLGREKTSEICLGGLLDVCLETRLHTEAESPQRSF